MTKQVLWTVLVFAVALGSGVVIGMNLPRATAHGPRDRSWLEEELKLTPEQREKMKAIWSEMLPGRRQGGERRWQAIKERDEAIAALVPPEKKAEYGKITARFEQQMAEMGKEREKAFQKAVEQTKAMLDPKQRKKYDELLKKGAFGPPRRGPETGTTAPTRPVGP